MTKLLKFTRDCMTTKGIRLENDLNLGSWAYHAYLLSELPTDILGFISCNYQIAIDETTCCPELNANDTYLTFMMGCEGDGGAFWTENYERAESSINIQEFLDYIGYMRGDNEDIWQKEYAEECGKSDKHYHVPKDLSSLTKEVYLKDKRATAFVKGSLLLGESSDLTYLGEPLYPEEWYEGQNEMGGDLFEDGMIMLTLRDVLDDFQNGAEFCYGFDKEYFYYCKEDKAFYVK